MKSKEEIQKELERAEKIVWWNRHVAHGRPKEGKEAAAKIEAEIPAEERELDDFEWGVVSGRMATLRWVLDHADSITDSVLFDS